MEIKQRRQNILCCITEYYDQHKANGLAFMLVPRYGRYFFLFFLSRDKTCWNLKLNEVLQDFLVILKQGTIGEHEDPNSSPYFVVSLICLRIFKTPSRCPPSIATQCLSPQINQRKITHMETTNSHDNW